MGEHRRKADGRRVFGTEFKRTAVQRILSGEKTLAELSRELDISPGVIRNWKRFAEAGATTAVQASEDVVPASQLREAYAKIREPWKYVLAMTSGVWPTPDGAFQHPDFAADRKSRHGKMNGKGPAARVVRRTLAVSSRGERMRARRCST